MVASGPDPDAVGRGYLEHLTDDDLRLLGAGEPGSDAVRELRAHPARVERLVGRPGTFDTVFAQAREGDPFLRASPFLVFAVAVHRSVEELRSVAFLEDRVGPRQRLPVFDVGKLREFVSHPMRRFFLVELLASYTRVASGSVLVKTGRGWRRQRFSELDPVRLASLLEVVPESERPGVYRRLGDLALFLTGVFPDHAASRALGPIDEGRLLRAGRITRQVENADGIDLSTLSAPGPAALLERLGERWYRAASATASSPLTGSMQVLGDVADRFHHARRVLNVVTDRYLFPFRSQWFTPPR